MDGISDRISMVIAGSGMKKVEVAKKLNVSPPFVSELCSGAKKPSARTISDLCQAFGVSENWLRTGEGQMYEPKTRNEQLAAFFGRVLSLDDDDYLKRICTALSRLNDEQLKKLIEIGEAMEAVFPEKDKKEEVDQ